MAANSSIEWTDASWNPVTGCTETSPGCDLCYARTFAERWRGIPGHPYEQGFDLKLWPDRLGLPLTWRKPRRIFVNSMSDLFHKDVPDEFIDRVFATMASHQARRHVFQVLTKRTRRMARYMEHARERIAAIVGSWLLCDAIPSWDGPSWCPWPLSNVWMGTSIENDTYTWRANYLRQVPAAVRFISAEPLLSGLPSLDLTGIHWLIAGAESSHGARPMDEDWVRDLRDRCLSADVAFFYKQNADRRGHKLPLPVLDGRQWTQYPDAGAVGE